MQKKFRKISLCFLALSVGVTCTGCAGDMPIELISGEYHSVADGTVSDPATFLAEKASDAYSILMERARGANSLSGLNAYDAEFEFSGPEPQPGYGVYPDSNASGMPYTSDAEPGPQDGGWNGGQDSCDVELLATEDSIAKLEGIKSEISDMDLPAWDTDAAGNLSTCVGEAISLLGRYRDMLSDTVSLQPMDVTGIAVQMESCAVELSGLL